jgi:hypothetical protein
MPHEATEPKITKTLTFEKKYRVDIADFKTTEEVDGLIEKREGRKLRVVKLNDHGVL